MSELIVELASVPPSANRRYVSTISTRPDGSMYARPRLSVDTSTWQEAATMVIRVEANRQGFTVGKGTSAWTVDLPFGLVTPHSRDVDNMVKAVLDSIAAALGLNDKFCTDVIARKRRHTGSCTIITLRLLERGAE